MVYLEPEAWKAHIAELRKECAKNRKPHQEDYETCGRIMPTASNGAPAFPDCYHRLKEAALRGDLALVKTIYEEEWLPHTAISDFSSKDLHLISCEALRLRHTPVVAFLLSHNAPFSDHQATVAVDEGMESLL